MSIVLNSMHPTSLIPQIRQRDSVEVIDVDELDDGELPPPPRPPQRRRIEREPDVLIIDSSGDEANVGATSSSSNPVARRQQRLHSLPPPMQDPTVPPVPRLPRRFAGQQGFIPPVRRHPPPFPDAHQPLPNIVRPINYAFPFEALLGTSNPRNGSASGVRSSRQSNPELPPRPSLPVAAPPSHHRPVMGLGGALISLNRAQEAAERSLRRQQAAVPGRARARHHSRQWWLSDPFSMDDDDDSFPLEALFGDAFMPPNDMIMRAIGVPRPKEPEYKPEFTHPDKAEPGFVYDFAPANDTAPDHPSSTFPITSSENPIVILDEDSAGPSSVPTSAAVAEELQLQLVCARCTSPLLLGTQTATKGPEEERLRKIWGLRCGHLIDGQCLEDISRPARTPEDQHALQLRSLKGKEKALVADEDNSEPQPESSDPPPMPGALDLEPRYPLRSRTAARVPTIPQIPSLPSPTMSSAPNISKSKTGRGRGSGRGKPKAETFEWNCPVASCGMVHASVRVGAGEWEMEKDSTAGVGMLKRVARPGRGAIAVFV